MLEGREGGCLAGGCVSGRKSTWIYCRSAIPRTAASLSSFMSTSLRQPTTRTQQDAHILPAPLLLLDRSIASHMTSGFSGSCCIWTGNSALLVLTATRPRSLLLRSSAKPLIWCRYYPFG